MCPVLTDFLPPDLFFFVVSLGDGLGLLECCLLARSLPLDLRRDLPVGVVASNLVVDLVALADLKLLSPDIDDRRPDLLAIGVASKLVDLDLRLCFIWSGINRTKTKL